MPEEFVASWVRFEIDIHSSSNKQKKNVKMLLLLYRNPAHFYFPVLTHASLQGAVEQLAHQITTMEALLAAHLSEQQQITAEQ